MCVAMPETSRLIGLLRHAKSSWDEPGLADFDRPLAPRGRDAAPRIGDWMAAAGMRPDHVLCSAACRTRQTWQLVAPRLEREGGSAPQPVFSEALYHAPPDRLLAALRTAPPGAHHLLLVGHNPGLGELAAKMAGDNDDPAAARLRRKFPTAALALFAADIDDWTLLTPSRVRLLHFVRPKDLIA